MTQSLSIRDLENLSGIKAHTIRIWEKRYSLFDPVRTPTNIRTYNPKDLKKLLNIVSVLDSGMKISKATSLSEEELSDEIENLALTNQETSNSLLINEFIISAIKCDIILFEKLFSKSVEQIGMENTIEDIIYPLLVKIGLMWTISKLEPAQEHFVSQLIRQKLFSAVNALPNVSSKEKYLLFLPEGEDHEIGLLYGYYLIKKAGKECIYLGPDTPLNGIIECVENANSSHILTQFVTSRANQNISEYLLKLVSHFGHKNLFVSGLCDLQIPSEHASKIRLLNSINDLKKLF